MRAGWWACEGGWEGLLAPEDGLPDDDVAVCMPNKSFFFRKKLVDALSTIRLH